MAPAAGQRSINAFFKAPAIATSVVLKPAAGAPAEDAEPKGVAESADPLVEDPSTNGGGADWQLGGCPRRPVATYKRRRRVDGGKGGGISKDGVKDGSRDEDAPSTSGGDPGGEPKRARSEIPMRDGSSKANAQAAAPTGMKQLFLDLGQKNFGHCKCPTCGLLYAKGEPEDERTHAKFHAEFTAQSSAGHHTRTSGLSSGSSLGPDGLTGAPYMPCPKTWRDTAVWTCADDPDRFVVSIGADDHRMRWGKVVTLAQKVETELGALEGWVLREVNARGTRAFVYVVKDVIVGALFAEPTRWAYRTLADDQTDAEDRRVKTDASQRIDNASKREVEVVGSARIDSSVGVTASHYGRDTLRRSEVATRAVMGVRAAWVHPAHRRKGTGTRLLTCAREFLVPGFTCDAREVGWTQPTEDGRALASATCGLGDGTFLVYG